MLLLSHISDSIAALTLNRPDALNALNQSLIELLQTTLRGVGSNPNVRAVVLTGAGRAFCAGSDVKELHGVTAERAERMLRREAELCAMLEELPQPVIAAINGHCLGGGLTLALSCDLRIASNTATFGFPEVKLGWNPPFGMLQAAGVVGTARALDLMLTGRTLDATEAHAIGLVHRVVPPEELLTAASELARTIATNPPAAVRAVKATLRCQSAHLLRLGVDAEMEAFLHCFETEEARENVRRFVEKRGR